MPAVVIPGRPVPKGRPRVGKGGSVYTPERTREYEQAVAWAVRASRGRVDGPCEVLIDLYLRPGTRGDLDNYAKAILDGAEKGGAFGNDRDVIDLRIRLVDATVGGERAVFMWDAALPEAA